MNVRARFPIPDSLFPMSGEFVFATAQYESGDWDSAPLVPANLIDSVARYTSLPIAPTGAIVALASDDLFRFPLVYLTGHLPVRFTDAERTNVRRFADRGGMLFVDDHNHDIDGAFHKTAVEELTRAVGPLSQLPNTHPIYSAFFKFPDGAPNTSHELNGWGDEIVHDYLRGLERHGRLGVLYSNKDYGCEWDYDWRNKRFQREDNTKFAVNLVVYAMTS